jgi:hypothetical protein
MTATATKASAAASKETETAAERIRELNEQVLDFGKKAGLQFLEAYETNMKTFADYHDKVADAAQIKWVATAARAQANFTREITRVYSTTTRDLLK